LPIAAWSWTTIDSVAAAPSVHPARRPVCQSVGASPWRG
jgi:hypothetical protein